MAANYIPAFDADKNGTLSKKELAAWNKAGRPVDNLSVDNMGANLGYAAAVLDEFPELQNIVKEILTKGITDPQTQLSMITGSKWFNSYYPGWMEKEKQRLSSDPAVWQTQVNTVAQQIKQQFADAGATLTDEQAADYADKYIHGSSGKADANGNIEVYDKAWLKKMTAAAIDFSKTKTVGGVQFVDLSGKAEDFATALYKTASDYGVEASMSDDGFKNWFESSLRGLTDGSMTAQDVDDYARDQAMSRFPGLAKQLLSGQTLKTAADPYMTTLAAELELDPGSLSFSDDLVQRTLNSVDANGTFKPMSLYDARLAARKDGRWQYTSAAKKAYTDVGGQILRDFGFLG